MPIALAPGREGLRVAALAEKGDDAIGELAKRHRVKRRGVESINDEPTVAADPFEAFTRRAFRGRFDGIDEDGRDEF